MRVITGNARGRKLKTLEGNDVRPTSDMVKEAIFSVIQFEVEGASVLDLFGGSGQLGIEALSRGAKYCRFVDQSRAAADIIRENVRACGFEDDCGITCAESLGFIRDVRMTFDIAFLDPPYRQGLVEKALPLTAAKMSPRGIIVCEHEKDLRLPEGCGELTLKKNYRYGKTGVTIYRVPLAEE